MCFLKHILQILLIIAGVSGPKQTDNSFFKLFFWLILLLRNFYYIYCQNCTFLCMRQILVFRACNCEDNETWFASFLNTCRRCAGEDGGLCSLPCDRFLESNWLKLYSGAQIIVSYERCERFQLFSCTLQVWVLIVFSKLAIMFSFYLLVCYWFLY